jgi:hypothetical protein
MRDALYNFEFRFRDKMFPNLITFEKKNQLAIRN